MGAGWVCTGECVSRSRQLGSGTEVSDSGGCSQRLVTLVTLRLGEAWQRALNCPGQATKTEILAAGRRAGLELCAESQVRGQSRGPCFGLRAEPASWVLSLKLGALGLVPHGQLASKWNMLDFSVPLLAEISSVVISVNEQLTHGQLFFLKYFIIL